MKHLLQDTNWKHLKELADNAVTANEKREAKQQIKSELPFQEFKDLIYHTFAAIKPIKGHTGKYSATDTFSNIPDIIKTVYGDITKDQFRHFS